MRKKVETSEREKEQIRKEMQERINRQNDEITKLKRNLREVEEDRQKMNRERRNNEERL